MLDLVLGRGYLITGVEDDPDGVKVFIGPRYKGYYVIVHEPEDIKEVRSAWGRNTGHVFLPASYVDPSAIYREGDEPTEEKS